MKPPFVQRVPRKFLGKYSPRIDAKEKAGGSAQFLDDITLPGQFKNLLYAKVLKSPHAHARIKSLDVSRAEKMSGVAMVLTYKDPEIAALKRTNCAWTSVNTSGYEQMYFPGYKDRRVLSDHACWVGDDAGVVVAAESEEIAQRALAAIKVEWEVLAFELDPNNAMEKDAPVIHPEIRADSNILPPDEFGGDDLFVDQGDVEKALAEAHITVDVSTRYPNTDHSCLDTRGCLMQWQSGRLTCWTNYYQADQTRMHIAQMLDLPLNKVRVKNPYAGASMGRGNTGEQLFFIYTAILARRTSRPVKFKYDRQSDFHDTRNALKIDLKMGATRDGRITAACFLAIGDAGAYAEHTMAAVKFIPKAEFPECLLAHIPNLKMEGYGVYTNKIPGSCMRGIGNAQYNFAIGRAVDELAEELELDPIEVVKKNFGHMFETLPNRSLTAVLTEGARRIGWHRRHKPGRGELINGVKKRGMGFSFHMAWHAAWQELARGHIQVGMRLNPDMSVILEAPQVETGPGSNSCAVFACAEALGFLNIPSENIFWVQEVDTDTGYKDMVQTDSAVSYLQAEMMPKAAARIKAKLLELAAPVLKRPAADLDIEDGEIFAKSNPTIRTRVADLLWQGDLVPIMVTVSDTLAPEKTGIPFVATFAEVEVDTETGRIDIVKIVPVHDCGTVMFAAGAEGQLVGGQAMGLGEAVYEEIVYDKKSGKPLNFNWIDYTIPSMLDFPEVEPVLLEIWRGAGEYGASGTGEVATTCTPRAVANAVYNAIGVRIDHAPLKPEKILAALAKKKKDQWTKGAQ